MPPAPPAQVLPPTARLQYAKRVPWQRTRLRLRRRLLLLAILLPAVAAFWQWGLSAIRASHRRYELYRERWSLYRQCLSYSAPAGAAAGAPVFDESLEAGPVAVGEWVDPGGQTRYVWRMSRGDPTAVVIQPPAADVPPAPRPYLAYGRSVHEIARLSWTNNLLRGQVLCASSPWLRRQSVFGSSLTSDGYYHRHVFVHARRSPAGRQRLLVVSFDPLCFLAGGPQPFSADVRWLDGRWGDMGYAYGFVPPAFAVPASKPLRLFAGQPDPLDESHFTIPYDAGGVAGTIDGWLQADDGVKLVVRDGPAVPATP